MSSKNLVFSILFAGIVPVCANASMVYTPSRPCGAVMGCDGECYPYVRQADFRPSVLWNNDVQQNTRVETSGVRKNAPADWYIGVNAAMNFWSWENEYNSNYGGTDLLFNKDEYSFESVFGGAIAVGTWFASGIRGDIELGMSAEFSDSDDLAEYKLSIPYLMANAYWDFDSGLYLGGGLGVARPKITLDGALFNGGSGEDASVSPKVGFALGYASQIADNTFIDFRYRISLMKGTDVSQTFTWEQTPGSGEQYILQVENDLILENALSVGIRFGF